MKIIKRKKLILLTLLILFPTTVILSSLITPVNAGPQIPNDHPNNKWHWGVDVGDTIMYEMELIVTNMTNQQITNMYRNREIYQISAINNMSGDYMGLYPDHNFSVVMMDRLWENETVGVLSPVPGPSTPLAFFGYNDSAPVKEAYLGGNIGGVVPIIFPINDTTLDVSKMAYILNKSWLTPFYQLGYVNKFNSYDWDVGETEIYFENTTDNYYFRASYYANNGTIKEMDAYYLMGMGADIVSINVTAKRVFELDITDEVEWSVDVGDTLYYHVNDSSSGYHLMKFDIQGFNKDIYWSTNWTMDGMDWPMTFQSLIAETYLWDGTQWLYGGMGSFTAANNFYPMCFPLMEMMGGQSSLIFPTSATLDDFKFLLNNDTRRLTGWFPFDIVIYNKTDSIVYMTVIQSGNGQEVYVTYNFTSGLIETQTVYESGALLQYWKTTTKIIEWPVNPGDIMYFKQNMGDDRRDYRAVINSITGELKNMTVLEQEMSMTPFPFTVPADQPELQFFSLVNATIEEWDESSESWISPTTPPYNAPWAIIAGANKYYPAAPHVVAKGCPPLIFPKGTISTDFQDAFSIFTTIFDYVTYGNDYIIMRNTTLGRELHFYFDGAAGKVHYIGGWNYMGAWVYMSIYPKYIETLSTGLNVFTFQSDLVTDITSTVTVTTSGSGVEYIFAVLSHNPVNESLPIGTPLWYFDQLIINSSLITGNITMTVTFPWSIDLSMVDLHFFAWDMGGTLEWTEPSPEVYDAIIYNYVTNSIIIENPPIPFPIISAISYENVPPGSFSLDSTAESPDDDGDFTLTWDAALGAESYSVYEYSSYITVINGSLTRRADHITSLSLPLTGYNNGTYYFIVVAHNANGDTLSNCITVVVEIPPEDGDGDGDGIIPGYPLYLLLIVVGVITSILTRRKHKKL